jgi:hypothetical protein
MAPVVAASGPAPAGTHVEGVAAEAAANADARREYVRGDETFQSSYTCIAPSGAADKAPIVCEGRIDPVSPELYFSLSWRIDEFGDRAVDTVHIRRKGEVDAFQTIADVGSRAAAQIPNNGFELIDVNFDGYHDLRLIAEGTAGPNVLYRNWLWAPDEEAFVGNVALDEIVSPEFERGRRRYRHLHLGGRADRSDPPRNGQLCRSVGLHPHLLRPHRRRIARDGNGRLRLTGASAIQRTKIRVACAVPARRARSRRR